MKLLIALLPAIGWGIEPLIINKVRDSRPVNQILGVGIGATIVGVIVTLTQHPAMSLGIFLLSMLTGLLWAVVGQMGQFVSFTQIGVSKTMPISTGLQLVGNTLIGVLIFGEWTRPRQYLLGILALVLIIIGVALTTVTGKQSSQKVTVRDFLFLLVTTIGYWVYSAFPKAVSASSQSMFLPQTLGILLGSILVALFSKQPRALKARASWLDVLGGLAWGIGSFAYMVSAKMNGVTSAFIYSQLNVIISTLGGMPLLGERKHGCELAATLIGLALIVVGAMI